MDADADVVIVSLSRADIDMLEEALRGASTARVMLDPVDRAIKISADRGRWSPPIGEVTP